jgi:rRNA pseudouridine-1189 N-methylase Emg1 (Nep1/Mra1 family)
MLRNVHPNIVMVALQNLIETPIYKDLNVNIHHQWASLFALHMNSKFKFLF